MRGPTHSAKAEDIEEAVVSELSETELENEVDGCHMACSRSGSNASSKKEEEDGNKPIWKVGRILIESLSKGKMRRTKIFAAPLEDLPLNCQGIPKIVQRLCSYLEQFGLKEPNLFASCKKHGKLVERFKISFDRAGDADLESCSDVKVIASLLKLWLHDLPHPLIPQRISYRLKISFQKYDKKEIYDLDAEICNVLITCPALNLGVLYTVIRLLYSYVTKWYSESYCDQLPEMFAKILIGDKWEMEHVEVISALIHNFHIIFNEKILERAFKLYVVRDKKSRTDCQKLAEVSLGVEYRNSALTVEKLLRSNSEEKLNMRNDHNQNLSMRNLNMRRVNSHEDFSGAQYNYGRTIQGHLANAETENLPRRNLNEFVVDSIHDDEPYDNEPVVDHFQKITFASDKDSEAIVAPPPFNYHKDDRVQEERRNEERFTPQFSAHRFIGRKKKMIHQSHNGRTRVTDTCDDELKYAVPKPGEYFDRNVNACVTCPDESAESYHWNTMQDCDAQSTCSTSSSSSSGNNSPDVILSPNSTRYSRDHLEPNNYRNWSYTHRHPFTVKSMNMIQKDSDEETMSSYVIRLSDVDSKISQINKHLQWTKKRLRYYDKIYKDGGGDALTGLKKMANQEYKQLSKTIIILKKNLKQLRKEANENFVAHRSLMSKNLNSSCNVSLFSYTTDTQKAAEKALKHLRDKRVASKRAECIEDMTHVQLLDEKVSIHETLVSLENIFGQTTARNVESFKPIYERYRTVRRFLGRSSISLKMKDAVSDLATIMENETMEFDTGSTIVHHVNDEAPSACQEVCKVAKNDFHTSNIHELSSPELMLEYKMTKDEKKKLRNRIYLYEQEAENQTINDTKYCIHTLRSRYKNTKAKLKLLEALLMKTK